MKYKPFLVGIAVCFAIGVYAQSTRLIKHTYYELYYYPRICSSIMGHYIQTAEHTRHLRDIDRSVFNPDTIARIGSCASDLDDVYKQYNAPFRTGTHTRDLHKSMDQGHINPYKAFTFSDAAGEETMLYTNVCPQVAYVNEQEWKRVEKDVIDTSRKYGDIEVWTGVLISLSHPTMVGTMYKPDWYWKVIVYKVNGRKKQKSWISHNVSANTNTKAVQAEKNITYIRNLIKQYYPTFDPGFPILN